MRLCTVIALSLILPAPAFSAVSVNGRWYTDKKDSIVDVGPCGATICGKISKILAPTPGGGPAVDSNNPDPALRKRPLLGLTLLSGFKDVGDEWAGTVYDPRAGKSYKSTMVKLANGNLKVKGCVGPFCRAVIFTPVR